MLRMLALPAAVAAVLAATACTAAGDANPGATGPETSSTQAGAPESGAPTPSETAPPFVRPHIYDSTDPALRRDPGQPGLPAGSGASVDDVLRLGAVASWLEQPDWIALSLPATSTCWALAAEPVLESATRIVVQFDAPAGPCGSPDAARTYEVPVPEGVDARVDLQLAVVGLEHEFTLTLPAT